LNDRMSDVFVWAQERFGVKTKLEHLAGDASSRDFYRLHLDESTSYILMDSSRTPVWPWLDVHDLLANMQFPVPKIIFSDEQKGLVVQEDLGSVRLCDIEDEKTYQKHLSEALKLLRRLQREVSPEMAQNSIAGRRYFTASFFMAELEHTLEHFFFRLLRVPVEELLTLQEQFRILSGKAMGSNKPVFTHRDFHSANLMVHKGKLVFIDWQDARFGPPCYDLSSILRDSYRDSGDAWKKLVSSYIVSSGNSNMFDFVFAALQRNMKAIGTFAYQYRAMRNDHYLKFIPRTLRYFDAYAKECPAVKPAIDSILELVTTYVGEIDVRNYLESDEPKKIIL